MSERRSLRISLRSIPTPLLIALGLGLIGKLLHDHPTQTDVRWSLFRFGVDIAAYIFITAGLAELVRRTSGRAHVALRIAMVAAAAQTVLLAARPVVPTVIHELAQTGRILQATWLGSSVVVAVLTVTIVTAADAWRRAPALAVTAVIACLLLHPPAAIDGWISNALDGHRIATDVYEPLVQAVWLLCVIGALIRIGDTAAPVARDVARAADGLRRAAAVIRFQVLLVLGLAGLTLIGTSSPQAIELITFAAPLVAIITLFGCVVSLVRAASAGLDGLPIGRIYLGGTAILWSIAIQGLQVAFQSSNGGGISFDDPGDRFGDPISAWSVIGPLAVTAGILLVLSALGRLAAARGDDDLREQVTVRSVLFVIFNLSNIGLALQVGKATSQQGYLFITLSAAVAGIGASLALAGLFARAATAIERDAALPVAKARFDVRA